MLRLSNSPSASWILVVFSNKTITMEETPPMDRTRTDEDLGSGFIAELVRIDRESGVMVPQGRSLPMTAIKGGAMMKLGLDAVRKLGMDPFIILRRVQRKEACTLSLGSGTSGSAFRVCESTPDCDNCVVVKLSFVPQDDGTVEETGGITKHEVRTTKAITDAMKGVSPHFVEFKGAFVSDKTSKFGSALFLEYIRPIDGKFGHLRSALRAGKHRTPLKEEDLRSILFQVCYSLCALAPLARHNDTKLDNIALTRWDNNSHSYSIGDGDDFLLPSQRFKAKIIDFGLSHGPSRLLWNQGVASDWNRFCKNLGRSKMPQLVQAGISILPNKFYDLHMFLFIVNNTCRELRIFSSEFRWGLEKLLIDIFGDFAFCPTQASWFRESIDCQRRMMRDEVMKTKSPADVLNHPFFAGFRVAEPLPTEPEFSVPKAWQACIRKPLVDVSDMLC